MPVWKFARHSAVSTHPSLQCAPGTRLCLQNSQSWSAFLIWAPLEDDPPVNGVSGNLTHWLCASQAALSVGLQCPVGHHQSQCELLVMAECEGQLGGKCTLGCEPEGLRDENWE